MSIQRPVPSQLEEGVQIRLEFDAGNHHNSPDQSPGIDIHGVHESRKKRIDNQHRLGNQEVSPKNYSY